MSTSDHPAVRVPADVTQPDRIWFRLTLRQTIILAGTTLLLWLAWRLLHPLLPDLVLLIAALPITALAVVIAIGRRDGLSLDRWLWHALQAARVPKHLTSPPAAAAAAAAGVAVLRLPATAIHLDGTVDLLSGQHAVLAAMSTVGFFLAGPQQQATTVDGFARWCNSLTGHTQITVSTRPVDLQPAADAIDEHRDTLPTPALRAAAGDFAEFLRHLAADRDPLARQILVTHTAADPATARRAADNTTRTLTAAGVGGELLDGTTVTDVLYAAADPWHPAVWGHALPDAIITTDRSTR